MSSSFGGGGSGQIRYVISVDDSQAIQKLQGVSQQLQQMPGALSQVSQETDKVSQSQEQMGNAVQKSTDAVKQQEQSQQSFGSVVKQNIGTLISMGSGILGLVSSYISLQRTQLQINKLQVTEANQRRMLGVLTRQHAAAVQKYGQNSQQALDIEAKINVLQARHANTLEQITVRQEQQTQAQLSFGLSVVQTGASIGQLIGQLKGLKTSQEAAGAAAVVMGSRMKMALIGTGVGAIFVAIGAALIIFTRNIGGAQDAIFGLGQRIGQAIPQLRGFLEMLQGAGIWLIKILGGELPAGAEQATAAVEDTSGAISDMSAETGKAQKEIADMWKELSDAPNITSALNIKVDKDKLTKKFLDYLPDSLSKDIKVFIKGRESVKTIRDSFSETFSLAMDMGLTKSDKWSDKFVKQTIKVLKEKFPNAPGSKELQAALAATISGPHTAEQVKTLIEQWKLDPTLTVEPDLVFPTMASEDVWDQLFAGLDNEKRGTGKTVTTHVNGLLDQVKTAITNYDWKNLGTIIGKGIIDSLKTTAGISTSIRTSVLDPIVKSMSGVAVALGDAFRDPKETERTRTAVLAAVGDTKFWHAAGLQYSTDFFNAWKSNTEIFGPIAAALSDLKFWGELGLNAATLFFGGWKDLATAIVPALTNISTTFSSLLSGGSAAVGGFLKAGRQILDLIWDGIVQAPANIWNSIASTIGEKLGGALNAIGGLGKGIIDFFTPQTAHGESVPGNKPPTSKEGKDIEARQIVQITKNLNIYAQAIVQVTKDNNVLAKTIVQITKNISQLAKAIVTTTKDFNQLAKAIVTTTKDNNQLAKTIVTLTKDNNSLARTINQVTKNLNSMARAMVQSTKDAKALASAIRSIPSRGGGGGGNLNFGSAQHGMHQTLASDTLILAHQGERVDIGHGPSGSSGGTFNGVVNFHISGSDLINERNLSKRIKLTVGENRDKYG